MSVYSDPRAYMTHLYSLWPVSLNSCRIKSSTVENGGGGDGGAVSGLLSSL